MTETPRDLLLACHGRIRRYCGGLQALCEVEPGDSRIEATAQSCHRYFGEALHLHAEDEDSSVLPRLAPHLSPDQVLVGAELGKQHVEINNRTPAVLDALLQVASLSQEQQRATFEPYWTLLLAHIELEEQELFQSLSKLSEQEQSRIVLEIRGRRRAVG
jgi:hemerythrin-like domain-containing protein